MLALGRGTRVDLLTSTVSPAARNPKNGSQIPDPEIRSPEPATRNHDPGPFHLHGFTLAPAPCTLHPTPYSLPPTAESWIPEPEIQNPEP